MDTDETRMKKIIATVFSRFGFPKSVFHPCPSVAEKKSLPASRLRAAAA
jgi:hypothetical protein